MAVRKAEAKLVDTTQAEQVIDEPDDPTGCRAECLLYALGEGGGLGHVTLRICAVLATSDQTAANSSSPAPGSNCTNP